MPINKNKIIKLKSIAKASRQDLIRLACQSRSPHIASSLSQIDLLTAFYFEILKINPKKPQDPKRDRFILSKGHAALSLYITLAKRGFFPMAKVNRYGQDDSILAAHPVYASVPGIEATTGSLGHGLPMALGMAIVGKRERPNFRVFALLSDGECDEGSNWEAIMLAGHLHLDNLTVIIDYNKIQSFGRTKEVLDLEPLAAKWQSMKWSTIVIDGHNFNDILKAASSLPKQKNKPTVIIANTIKGKGVPFMEDKLEWHYLNVKAEDLEKTLKLVY